MRTRSFVTGVFAVTLLLGGCAPAGPDRGPGAGADFDLLTHCGVR